MKNKFYDSVIITVIEKIMLKLLISFQKETKRNFVALRVLFLINIFQG